MKSLRTLIIGCGGIAAAHVQAIRSTGGEIAALYDLVPGRAREFASSLSLDIPTESELPVLINTIELDVAVICTPPVTHHAIGLMCLRAGLHVLCEKPLAIAPSDAAGLHATARSLGKQLFTSAKFRFVPAIQLARALCNAGEIGDLKSVDIQFCSPVDMRGRWNSDPAVSGGGVLMDNGPHALDLARYFAGPLTLQSVRLTPASHLPLEDEASLTLENASGAVISIELSWRRASEAPYFLKLTGTAGEVTIGWHESSFRTIHSSWQSPGYSKTEAFRAQYREFLNLINGFPSNIVQAEDGKEVVRLINEAYTAAKSPVS